MGSGEAAIGGQTDPADRYIAPTVLKNVVPEDPVMSEEIFGPILPVLSIDGAEAAIRFINGRDKPLALYIFTGDDAVAESILSRTSSGGATVNHVMLHYAVSSLRSEASVRAGWARTMDRLVLTPSPTRNRFSKSRLS